MTRLPIYQVDAFADRLFGGNPAAVVLLETWLPDDRLLAVAAENNLSETAFLVPRGGAWDLRWFTPAAEVDLCGHATLAGAFVLHARGEATGTCVFETREAGTLRVAREGEVFVLDLPSRPAGPVSADAAILTALGLRGAAATLAGRDYVVVLEEAAAVRALVPDMAALAKAPWDGVIVTAPGDEPGIDFVSRYFAPALGIPEDPATGSAHCTLAPYWAGRLGKAALEARQVSRRGGALGCRVGDGRVLVSGRAVLYLEGTITA